MIVDFTDECYNVFVPKYLQTIHIIKIILILKLINCKDLNLRIDNIITYIFVAEMVLKILVLRP